MCAMHNRVTVGTAKKKDLMRQHIFLISLTINGLQHTVTSHIKNIWLAFSFQNGLNHGAFFTNFLLNLTFYGNTLRNTVLNIIILISWKRKCILTLSKKRETITEKEISTQSTSEFDEAGRKSNATWDLINQCWGIAEGHIRGSEQFTPALSEAAATREHMWLLKALNVDLQR